MSRVSVNNIFTALFCLSAISAFVVPVEYTNTVRGKIDGLFMPAAYPLRRAALSVTRRFQPEQYATDIKVAGPSTDARAELERLRTSVANLQSQLAELQRRSAE